MAGGRRVHGRSADKPRNYHQARLEPATGLADCIQSKRERCPPFRSWCRRREDFSQWLFAYISGQPRVGIARLGPTDTTLPTDFFQVDERGRGSLERSRIVELVARRQHWLDPGNIDADLDRQHDHDTYQPHLQRDSLSPRRSGGDQNGPGGGIVVAAGQTLTIDDGPGTDVTDNGGLVTNEGLSRTTAPLSSITPSRTRSERFVYRQCCGLYRQFDSFSIKATFTPGLSGAHHRVPEPPDWLAIYCQRVCGRSNHADDCKRKKCRRHSHLLVNATMILGNDLHLYDWLNGFQCYALLCQQRPRDHF